MERKRLRRWEGGKRFLDAEHGEGKWSGVGCQRVFVADNLLQEKQIPFGNDNKKRNSKDSGKSKRGGGEWDESFREKNPGG